MQPTDRNDPSADDATLGAVYRAGMRELPPARVDAAILAAARQEVGRSSYRRVRQWAVPLSAAATMVLAVGLVVFMNREGIAPVGEMPVATPAPAPVTAPAPRVSSVPEVKMPARRERASAEAYKTESPEPASAPGSVPMHETALADSTAAALSEKRAVSKFAVNGAPRADVVAVRVEAMEGGYRFEVTVRSDDRGCVQYADWWEIVSPDGRLLFRRILEHSHEGEQPFTRAGGPVAVAPDTQVWVRAHMHPTGYAGTDQQGSVAGGFRPAIPDPPLPHRIATELPQPVPCGR